MHLHSALLSVKVWYTHLWQWGQGSRPLSGAALASLSLSVVPIVQLIPGVTVGFVHFPAVTRQKANPGDLHRQASH